LLRNTYLAPHDKADVDSVTFEAEEWSADDPREEYMAQSDCNNTATNPTELAESDTHLIHIPISKSNLRESGDESEPAQDNNGGVSDINGIKSLVWKIM